MQSECVSDVGGGVPWFSLDFAGGHHWSHCLAILCIAEVIGFWRDCWSLGLVGFLVCQSFAFWTLVAWVVEYCDCGTNLFV